MILKEARKTEFENKNKLKLRNDKNRNSKETDIKDGRNVLMRQHKSNKLSAPYNLTPMKITRQNGTSFIIKGS